MESGGRREGRYDGVEHAAGHVFDVRWTLDDLRPITSSAPVPGMRKRRRGVSVLPSLFTLGNCLCGFAAIHYASLGDKVFSSHFALAGYFVFLAMVFDMFDGFVARLTRSTSDFGAELDSLADMVSFGVAPAFLAVRLMVVLQQNEAPSGRDYLFIPPPFSDDAAGRLFWVIAAIYVSCTALRLARFNVITQPDVQSHMYFRGLPSPGAAAIVAGSVLFFEQLNPDNKSTVPFHVPGGVREQLSLVMPYLLPPLLLVSALLMVSRFNYVHLVNRFLRGRKRFRKLVWIFLLAMVMLWQPQITVMGGIYLYALSAPLTALVRAIWRKPAPGGPVRKPS
jgi:CDP-diacylglycerol---serine O-phosphatidyltransferase